MQSRERFSRIIDRVYPPNQPVTNAQASAGNNQSSTSTNAVPEVANGGQAAQLPVYGQLPSQSTPNGSGHATSAADPRYAGILPIAETEILTQREVLQPQASQIHIPIPREKMSQMQTWRSRPNGQKASAEGDVSTNATSRARIFPRERAICGGFVERDHIVEMIKPIS